MRGCDAFISVDTGFLHLAGSLGVPTVGLFGPTDGALTCEFYPTVRVLQGPQPDWDKRGSGVECHAPCHFSKRLNNFHCQQLRTSACMDFDLDKVMEVLEIGRSYRWGA